MKWTFQVFVIFAVFYEWKNTLEGAGVCWPPPAPPPLGQIGVRKHIDTVHIKRIWTLHQYWKPVILIQSELVSLVKYNAIILITIILEIFFRLIFNIYKKYDHFTDFKTCAEITVFLTSKSLPTCNQSGCEREIGIKFGLNNKMTAKLKSVW